MITMYGPERDETTVTKRKIHVSIWMREMVEASSWAIGPMTTGLARVVV